MHLKGIVSEDEDFVHGDEHFGPLEGCEYDNQQNNYKLVIFLLLYLAFLITSHTARHTEHTPQMTHAATILH
jgi:hypothetical protein